MRSRRRLARLSVGALAISLALHAVGAGVALFPGEIAIVTSAMTGDTIVAELVPAEPTAISPETLARVAARARAAPAAAPRSGRPLPTTDAPAPSRPPAEHGTAPEEGVALVRADPQDPEPETVTAKPEPPTPPRVAQAETAGADSRQAPSPSADTGDRPDGSDPAAIQADQEAMPAGSTEADVAGVRAQAPDSSLINGPTILPEAPRSVLEDIAARAALSTRAEAEPFLTRRGVFEFLLDHPDFATHVTRALKVGRYRIWRTDEGLFLDDGWGATGRLAILHRTAGTRVMYAKGQYEALLLPRIRGEAVVVIEYGFRAVGGGMDLVSAVITSYVSLESRALALAAKVASGAAARKADAETRKLLRSFARVSQAIDENPAALMARLRERPEVPSRELHEFATLLGLD